METKKALTRNGQEIKIGHRYLFAGINGDNIFIIIEIIDADSVRINDFYKSSRWACNALFEVK